MPFDPKTAFTVGQVNEYIKYLIEDSSVLDSLYVVGEISNLTAYHTSGHMYFSLKDETGVLRAVMFKSSAMKLKFRPENGMRVLVHGRVTVYAPSGQYQISCDSMEPDGFGALAAAYEQLKNRLAAEGLFDEANKQPLPPYPRAVGIITSPTGAAVRDIINIISRRAPTTKMILFPTLVQGENAPRQLTSGIRYFNKYKTVDVIIIGRGGGSLEELWAFNDEGLARAIAASEIPVISAVGHETDFTICDFSADLRAPTPSAAAELAVPDAAALSERILMLSAALDTHMRTRLTTERRRLATLAEKRVLQAPERFLQNRRMDVDALTAKLVLHTEQRLARARAALDPLDRTLQQSMQTALLSARGQLHARTAKLEALSPLAVLTRGYAAVFDEDGSSVRSAADIRCGDILHLQMSDGTVTARAQTITTDKENSHD